MVKTCLLYSLFSTSTPPPDWHFLMRSGYDNAIFDYVTLDIVITSKQRMFNVRRRSLPAEDLAAYLISHQSFFATIQYLPSHLERSRYGAADKRKFKLFLW